MRSDAPTPGLDLGEGAGPTEAEPRGAPGGGPKGAPGGGAKGAQRVAKALELKPGQRTLSAGLFSRSAAPAGAPAPEASFAAEDVPAAGTKRGAPAHGQKPPGKARRQAAPQKAAGGHGDGGGIASFFRRAETSGA